jgi:chorismate mutase
MMSLLRKFLPSGVGALIFTAIGFLIGQYVPAYFDYANERRSEVSSLVNLVTERSDDLETSLRPIMLIAGDAAPASDEPKKVLDNKMLALFQTLDTVRTKLPQSEKERIAYVAAMRELKEASGDLTNSQTAGRLIEAASRFKKARTDYEKRLSELEPTFLEAVFSNVL